MSYALTESGSATRYCLSLLDHDFSDSLNTSHSLRSHRQMEGLFHAALEKFPEVHIAHSMRGFLSAAPQPGGRSEGAWLCPESRPQGYQADENGRMPSFVRDPWLTVGMRWHAGNLYLASQALPSGCLVQRIGPQG